MEQEFYKQITKAIDNWPNADVRTVPGVMYQIRCGNDENDPNIEYRIHWFTDCSETFIHNHRYPFVSLCLEGEYTEKLWKVVNNPIGTTTYQFHRKSGNDIDPPTKIPGKLCHVDSRSHFPGNALHVDTEEYHSISPITTKNGQVLTFVAQQKHSLPSKVHILSSSPTISAPIDKICQPTPDECQKVYTKLQHILSTRYQNEIQLPQKNH